MQIILKGFTNNKILKTKQRFKIERHNAFTEKINKIALSTNKGELQQNAFIHSSDTDFQDFMNLYKNSTVEPYSFLDIDTTLPSNNYSRFRKNLLETI